MLRRLVGACLAVLSLAPHVQAAGREEWIDRDTGRRVVRLSRREGDNWGFYFHQNPFTAEGDKMVFLGSTQTGRDAFTVALRTFEVRQITFGKNVQFEVVDGKRRTLFYLSGDTVYATHLDSLETREVAKVPRHYVYGRGFSVNADGTLLLGCYALGEEDFYAKMSRDRWIEKIFEAKLPTALYTIDLATGRISEFHREREWLGHAQFSPTDSHQVEFCREGPGRRVRRRMWLIGTAGSGLRDLYPPTVPNTLVTHEFWSPDGKGLWFDLQVPRLLPRLRWVGALVFPHTYMAHVDIDTGEASLYPLSRSQYSWHYNVSADGRMLCGDGHAGIELARSAKWIFLYRPEEKAVRVERLCSMAGHSYSIAPNARFTPDGKWVVFQSDMSGSPQVYAVEVSSRLKS